MPSMRGGERYQLLLYLSKVGNGYVTYVLLQLCSVICLDEATKLCNSSYGLIDSNQMVWVDQPRAVATLKISCYLDLV